MNYQMNRSLVLHTPSQAGRIFQAVSPEGKRQFFLSFDVFIPSFILVQSPPRDLQIIAYK